MPNAVTISIRSSPLANSIIPVFQPSEDEVVEALSLLGMTPETVICASGDGLLPRREEGVADLAVPCSGRTVPWLDQCLRLSD